MEEFDIVIAGYAGEAGAARIAKIRSDEMLRWFRKDYAERLFTLSVPGEVRDAVIAGLAEQSGAAGESEGGGNCIAERHPVSEGGVLAELYRIVRERKCGLQIRLRDIPVRQDTIEVCEFYELNPYRLWSDCDILLCRSGGAAAEALNAQGIPAGRIGRLTKGLDKVITDKTETEYLNRPERDELYKVLTAEQIENIAVQGKGTGRKEKNHA